MQVLLNQQNKSQFSININWLMCVLQSMKMDWIPNLNGICGVLQQYFRKYNLLFGRIHIHVWGAAGCNVHVIKTPVPMNVGV